MSNLLSQASLVMIPSGYKEDVVYSQIPTDGSGDLSFTRASNGTRVNSAGLVEVCPWNLLEQSESFSTSPWANTNVTLTSGQIDPNGGTTAFRAQFSGVSYLLQNLTALNGTNSVYAKAYGSTAKIRLCDPNGSFSTQYNLTTEWQRITTSGNALAGFSIDSYIDGGWTSQDIIMAFAQANIGSTAKPYFPTTDRLNVPRLTYQNGGGGCPSLLLEKQSTNLFLYSEDFNNGAWSPIESTITANQTTSPDGTQNADKITEDSSNGLHLFYNAGGVSAGAGTWTTSIFYKKGTRRYFSIKLQIGSSSYTQVFDADGLTTGGSSSNGLTSISSTIVSMGNGWVRATLTGTDASGGGSGYGIFSLSNSLNPSFDPTNYNPTYQGSTSEYGFFWGAQLEASSYPTSYIPTTSSSATRVADECRKGGISSLIGQTEGTIFGEILINPSGESQLLWQRNPSTGLYTDFIYVGTDSDGYGWARVVVSGNVVCDILTASPLTKTWHKYAFAYKQNDFVLYIDGVNIGTDTNGNVPSNMSEIYLDQYIDGGLRNASKKQFALFKTRLTNAELALLTTI